MEFLKDWVRNLVMLVILAGCLELLVPAGGMKKYVRMTMGLLVVLAVTRPILGFLGRPIVVDLSALASTEGQPLPGLEQIMQQATAFRAKNSALALDEVRWKIEAEVSDAAKRVKGVKGATARATLKEQDGQYQLAEVTVAVEAGESQGLVKPVEPIKPVRPVQPVQVSTGDGAATGDGPTAPDETPEAAPPPTAAQKQLADAVRQEVAARLGIPANSQSIRVLVNGGKQE
ncbi:MAG: stage III sporulation protein AF [Mycobacterium leprae]